MSKYHVNPKTGNAGPCSAEIGNCPFGGEENHYTSREGAQVAYEMAQASNTLPDGLREMNSKAKYVKDPKEIDGLIASGSERTLGILSQNTNLTLEQQNAILDRATSAHVRASIFLSKKDDDYSKMRPEDAEDAFARRAKGRTYGYYYEKKLFGFLYSKDLDDDIYDKLRNSDKIQDVAKSGLFGLLDGDNKISNDKVREELSKSAHWRLHPFNGNKALENGKLTKQDLLDAPDDFINGSFSATGPSPILSEKSIDTLAEVAVERGDERLATMVARDARTSSKALSLLSDSAPEAVYLNPKTDAKTRQDIVDLHSNRPYIRMGELKKKMGEEDFGKIVKSSSSKSLNGSGTYSEKTIYYDLDLIKKHNLTRDDILYLSNSDSYNAGGSYDEATGTMKLRLDSGD